LGILFSTQKLEPSWWGGVLHEGVVEECEEGECMKMRRESE